MADKYVKAVEPMTGKEEKGLGTGPTMSPLIDSIKGGFKKMVGKSKPKTEYPDQQKELKDLYETGISDKDIATAKGNKKGGIIKKMAKGGMTASSRADGCCTKGKTKGKIC